MTLTGKPRSLIINTPYLKPEQHWGDPQSDGSLPIVPKRRLAGYDIFDPRNQTRRFIELEQVNKIRIRVDDWREAGYPGVTSVTRRLLEHWHDPEQRDLPFYFCQLEAIETLIWWVEAQASYKQGIVLPNDGGLWERLCNKMATGTGKTTVMAMIITWQTLNAVTFPKRKEFSKAIFIVTPGITVKERLQVLYPGHSQNYYDEFALCPSDSLRQKVNQVAVLIENWHQLMPQKQPERSVVKKGKESDEAFTRRVLGKLSAYKDLLVINDEAHHAYRVKAEMKISKKEAEELGVDLDEATRWIEGLDRIHKTRRILRCFDLSATPFAPTGKRNTEAGLFEWILSDFGLNDAIRAARKAFDGLQGKHFSGDRDYLALQLIQLVEQFLASERLVIPSLFHQEDVRKRVLLSLNIDQIVQHLARHIEQQNLERIEPIFDTESPIGSTENMRTWYTTKPNHPALKSQISHVVFDSTWEAAEAFHLEHSDWVSAYAKNDHLGFYVLYLYNGVVRKFFPDYLIRLQNGKTLILEVKGQDSEQNKVKRQHLDQWVQAVNQHGGFGEWCADVSLEVPDIGDKLARHGGMNESDDKH